MSKNIINLKRLLMIFAIGVLLQGCSSSPKVTMDPIKDAQTCIKLYEKNEARGTAYMQEVISTYYMQGKHDEHDKFAEIVTRRMAEIDFQ